MGPFTTPAGTCFTRAVVNICAKRQNVAVSSVVRSFLEAMLHYVPTAGVMKNDEILLPSEVPPWKGTTVDVRPQAFYVGVSFNRCCARRVVQALVETRAMYLHDLPDLVETPLACWQLRILPSWQMDCLHFPFS